MPVFAEFLLVAFLIYLWESALWLPKRGLVLRRRWIGGGWRVMVPGRWLATRELGVVALLPLPPDAGLAPCGGFPLVCDDDGGIFSETGDGDFRATGATGWDDFHWETPRLRVGGVRVRCQSPLVVEPLRRWRARGVAPAAALRRIWRCQLDERRARRLLRRWQLVSSGLRWLPLLLVLGFFVGLPGLYLWGGPWLVLGWVLLLWGLMAVIACRVWWLGNRVFPAARAELRMDALLSLLVPFHAMRALEIVSVHAFAGVHPLALLVATGDLRNPWLGKFTRRVLHPRPENPGDEAMKRTVLPPLDPVLRRCGVAVADWDVPPVLNDDPEAVACCPRCHAHFAAGPVACPDCGGLPLVPLR